MTNSLSDIIGTPSLSDNAGGKVSEEDAGSRRTPIVILVDVSSSTTQGVNPDLPQIQRMLGVLVDLMRQPPAISELGAAGTTVDVAIVTYAARPTLIQPFAAAPTVAPAPPLVASIGTCTATALLSSLDYVGKRLAYYDTYQPAPIPKAIPHIFHLTDGAPTDVSLNDERWQLVQRLLGELSRDKAKPFSMITHFVSPNGMVAGHGHVTDAEGRAISGYNMLSLWTGGENVFELTSAPDMFIQLARVIAKSIGGASSQNRRINDVLQELQAPVLRKPDASRLAPPREGGAA